MPNSTRYRVTLRARDDLIAIARYTAANWGRAQRDIYMRNMEQRFVWLAENPSRGRHRQDIKKGYHCYPQGSHLIFYVINEWGIDIIGIPHKRMDIEEHF
ncbi:type II toxin-antitoxin system RelE/ParE family toxin [Alloalcanivorax dieselolei]|uniref:type II toxin-antitoxin system RelE/ParE family toxin n=1 Tax=Alloalcanivorax dieselolei TaxID=285091 RepID=UPI0005A1D3C0|nr:type II toxin-antitoxin system RelE/ParE family toxin [Alloalcanivorax dieselolei]